MTKSSETKQSDVDNPNDTEPTGLQGKRGGRRRPWNRNRNGGNRNRRNRVPAEPADPTWVYAGNLGLEVTDGQLRDFFASRGEVTEVSITKNPRGTSWGKANFANEEQAQAALELNGEKLAGMPVIVEPLKHAPRAKATEKSDELDETVLFVGNLNQDLAEANLEELFKDHGNVISVTITKTRRNRPWATVEFETKDEAAAAIAALDGSEISGKTIAVRIWKKPLRPIRKPSESKLEPTTEEPLENNEAVLFVGNLNQDATEADVEDLFKDHGTLVSVTIARTRRARRSPSGWATVEFATKEEAAAAIAALDGQELSDRTIAVRIWRPLRQAGSTTEESQELNEAVLFVGNLNQDSTKEDLESLFKNHGTVVSVAVARRIPRSPGGWATVEFTSKDEAAAAIAALDGTEFSGRTIVVRIHKKKTDRPLQKPSGESSPAGPTLFVGNLARTVTRADLETEFAEYGEIVKAAIPRPKRFGARRWGIVEFATQEQVEKAIGAMNGVELAGETLIVEPLRKGLKKKAPRKKKGGLQNSRGDVVPVADEPKKQGRARTRVSATDDAPAEEGQGDGVSSRKRKTRRARAKRVVTDPDCHLFVGNVGYSVSQEDLKAYLDTFGQVTSIEGFNGWATLEMGSAADAQNLISKANGVEFQGRTLVVRLNSQVIGTAPEESVGDE